MDSLITAAARALAAGDPLGALNRVALRDDAPALALRGIAMAQLGDFARAKALLRRAGRAFGPREAVARARCTVAEAEVALAARDLGWAPGRLDEAASVLEAHDDRANAAHARLLDIRRLLLIGRLGHAGERLAGIDPARLPAALRAIHGLASAGIALRRMEARAARVALEGARDAAGRAGIPALIAEVGAARRLLDEPAARLIADGAARPLLLDEVEDLQSSQALIVDACRHAARDRDRSVSLATRPVLFALLRALAEAWPQDAPREVLIAQAFGSRFTDETYRARLRVEIGRLRAALRPLARISATERGFVIAPRRATGIAVLARPVEEKHATVLALMADGETWSSSALALALGSSQRSVQRALDALAEAGKVQFFGQARARRWVMPPMPGFATSLLLPVSWPDG
ncbi:helix-turn-helix domain-containing protein [Bosea sp. MMO-172]|uniref:helix-turn-helix domain-containing protein n=1 Tax=Bosea sp. MMO-172 TaxID=3127885 RepID=UPI0030171EBF